MKTYYELLEVTPDAPADEIKRAFRREIAKYHPDKVQHLGKEFQDIAANKAAELTQAYKTLSDPERRAEYDELLASGGAPEPAVVRPASPAAAPHAAQQHAYRPPPPPPSPQPNPERAQFASERQGVSDLMRRAAIGRFQSAVRNEFSKYETASVPGFDVVVLPAPGFFGKAPPAVLGRVVPAVNGTAVAETWAMASRMKKDPQREVCVFLMGPTLASATELAVAIAEQRRRAPASAGKLVLIPVNTNDWNAHVPTDAPHVCKSMLTRLKSNV